METWLDSETFVGITNFISTDVTNVSYIQLVCKKLQYVLPTSTQSMFLDTSYRGKGFEMWMRLIQSYAPTDSMSTFVHFMKVYKLKQGTSEDWHKYTDRFLS